MKIDFNKYGTKKDISMVTNNRLSLSVGTQQSVKHKFWGKKLPSQDVIIGTYEVYRPIEESKRWILDSMEKQIVRSVLECCKDFGRVTDEVNSIHKVIDDRSVVKEMSNPKAQRELGFVALRVHL